MATISPDNYSPIFQGDTGALFAPAFKKYVNGVAQPFDLSGKTITMRIVDEDGNATDATGSWTTDDAVNGLAHYAYSSADVANSGPKTLYIKITDNTTGKPVHAGTKTLQIMAAP